MTGTEGGTAGKRRLPIDLDQLEEALSWRDGEAEWYLDLQTGEVILATPDALSDYERATEAMEEGGIDLAAALERLRVPEWERESVEQIDQIESDGTGRFIVVPGADSSEGYEDMETFINSVSDGDLADELSEAIQGRGAFRRFKDTLAQHRHWQDAWYAYSHARERQRALDWLESQGIEATPREEHGRGSTGGKRG